MPGGGNSALMFAVIAGSEEAVQKLLLAGAEVTLVDRYGNNALALAVSTPLLSSPPPSFSSI